MSDLLAEVGDLSAFIGDDLDEDVERLLLELATGSVQAAAGQRIVQVNNDQVEVLGSTGVWLCLPERPIISVASVLIDGAVVTDFTVHGSRLWRRNGWASSERRPSTVTVVYSHGYPSGDPNLQFAKHATLLIAAQMQANPTGVTGYSIDDYREQYSQASGNAAGQIPESLRKALRQKYGLGVWKLPVTTATGAGVGISPMLDSVDH